MRLGDGGGHCQVGQQRWGLLHGLLSYGGQLFLNRWHGAVWGIKKGWRRNSGPGCKLDGRKVGKG